MMRENIKQALIQLPMPSTLHLKQLKVPRPRKERFLSITVKGTAETVNREGGVKVF